MSSKNQELENDSQWITVVRKSAKNPAKTRESAQKPVIAKTSESAKNPARTPESAQKPAALTEQNIVRNIIDKTESHRLKFAKMRLWKELSKYLKMDDPFNFQIHGYCHFERYLAPWVKRYFQTIAYDREFFYGGSEVCVTAWELPNGTFVFLGTAEVHGTCELCDYGMHTSDELEQKQIELKDLQSEISEDPRSKEMYMNQRREVFDFMEWHLMNVFRNIRFYNTLKEAKYFVSCNTEKRVEFKTFSRMPPLINHKNFPTLK